jgi:tRNA(Ile)-lysidine synthase
VRAALRRAGIAWRDDSSNGDRSFVRNRVRLDLLPAFRSLHPAAEANLLRTAALLDEDEAALDSLATRLLDGAGGLLTSAVAEAPEAVLRRALRRVAGFPAPRPVAVARVAALARSRSGAGAVPLGAGRTAERRYERIAIVSDAPAFALEHEVALAVPGDTTYGDAVVRCTLAAGDSALDAALAPALVVRAPRAGERLPGARRTVARMLLEARVPRSERARYPVVAVHGEPIALPGIAVAAALRRPTGLVLTIAAS